MFSRAGLVNGLQRITCVLTRARQFHPLALRREKRLAHRGLAVLLIAALLITMAPVGPSPLNTRVAYADPGTFVQAIPSTFSSWGESTKISWDYSMSHPTIIEISRDGEAVYQITGTYGPGINSVIWRGETYDGRAEDGTYRITVIPDDEWRRYSVTTYVSVVNPPPAAPAIGGVTPDLDGGRFTLYGTAEAGSNVSVYLDNIQVASVNVGSSGSWQYSFNLSTDTAEQCLHLCLRRRR